MSEYSDFSATLEKSNVRTLKQEIEKYYIFWFENKNLLDVLHKNNMLEKIVEVSVNFPVNDMVSLKRFLPVGLILSPISIGSFPKHTAFA